LDIDPVLLAHVDDSRAFNEQYLMAMSANPLSFATAEDALRTRAVLDAAVPPLAPERLQPEVIQVGEDQPRVTVRLFVPERVDGVCVQFHMGAWVIGSARASDDRSAEIAERCSVAVASVDYRMAPEALPPAQLEDALNVVRWARTEGRRRLGDVPIVLIGESAGCTLAVLTLLELRGRGELGDDIAGATLAYGLYDVSGGPSQRLDVDAFAVFNDAQRLVYPHLTIDERRVPTISPLYADLASLPPALFSVGTNDALIDDTLFMYERWRAAGNTARLEVYPESVHGFDSFPTAMAAEARRRIDTFIVDLVEGRVEDRAVQRVEAGS
jgi:acetyl esterase/lipase